MGTRNSRIDMSGMWSRLIGPIVFVFNRLLARAGPVNQGRAKAQPYLVERAKSLNVLVQVYQLRQIGDWMSEV